MNDICLSIRRVAPGQTDAADARDRARVILGASIGLLCLIVGPIVLEHPVTVPAFPRHLTQRALQDAEFWQVPLGRRASGPLGAKVGRAIVADERQADDIPTNNAATSETHSVQNMRADEIRRQVAWQFVLRPTSGSGDVKQATDTDVADSVPTGADSIGRASNHLLDFELEVATAASQPVGVATPTSNGVAFPFPSISGAPRPAAVTVGDVEASPLTPLGIQEAARAPVPLLIADVAPSSLADQRPQPHEFVHGGFADDDLAPNSTESRGLSGEQSPEEPALAPLLVAIKPSVNQRRSRPADVHSRPILHSTKQAPSREGADDVDLLLSPPVQAESSEQAGIDSRNDEQDELEAPDSEPTTAPEESDSTSENEPSRSPRALPTPPLKITRQMAALRPQIERALRFYEERPLNTRDDSAWSVMHSLLGYGVNTNVAVGGPEGRRTNAVGWMCWNNPCAGRRLLYLDNGYVTGREGPGFQGHPGQFLAMLAQIRLKQDYPLRIEGKLYSVEDLIEAEKRTCRVNRELTFKLIGLAHYLDSDEQWVNDLGETWNIPKMLRIEMAQPVNGAACGGTHRIMACSYAVYKREQRGETLDGPYAQAKKYVRDYQRFALSLQNRDGSFSSDWFKRRTNWGDRDRQLQTTGHILEWLVFSLPRNELSDPRVVGATQFLANLMVQHRYHDWEVGPRGHALRALSLYHQRAFQPQPRTQPLAQRDVHQSK